MIPRIKRIKDNPELGKYLVVGYLDGGNYGSDACSTLLDAFRFWLYHCGVSPKICFGFYIGGQSVLCASDEKNKHDNGKHTYYEQE